MAIPGEKRFIFLLILLVLVSHTYCQKLPDNDDPELPSNSTISINELMQSNVDCITDDLNEFPDSWVELYNAGSETIKLDNYSIGISDNLAESYNLSPFTIEPNGFIIIYCDKESKGMHTNFRIESGEGELFLFKEGQVVDFVSYKKQPSPNIAYGRKIEGSEEWGYQLVPTPGAINGNQIANGILQDPVFSSKGAILTGGTSLSIDLPSNTPEGTIIRYTNDGSEPSNNSILYDAPISINETSVIRAKLFCDGYISPRSVTRSFINLQREQRLPVVSMVTNNEFIYSDNIGIYSNNHYRADSSNFKYNWRRPVNIELFDKDGNVVINQLCETRIHGGGSRQYPLKSMVCYANKRFGTKRFKYEFFPSVRPGVKEQKSFILRNSGSDFVYLYMRDAIIQGWAQKYLRLDTQAYQPVVFYLNGEYMGLMYLMERSTEDNIETNYGIEDFDMIENWMELKNGDWNNFNAFRSFYEQEGHTFEEWKEWMDVDEFCDYMIMQLFFANRDFPNNNIVMWRPRAAGGKWRWLVKDMDFGLGLETNYDFDIFRWFYGDETAPNEPFRRLPDKAYTVLFRNLMKNDTFRKMFIERSEQYVSSFMNSDGVHQIWDALWKEIGEEYLIHRNKYENWGWTWRSYDWVWNGVEEWISKRPSYYLKHMNDFYEISSGVSSTLASEDDYTITD